MIHAVVGLISCISEEREVCACNCRPLVYGRCGWAAEGDDEVCIRTTARGLFITNRHFLTTAIEEGDHSSPFCLVCLTPGLGEASHLRLQRKSLLARSWVIENGIQVVIGYAMACVVDENQRVFLVVSILRYRVE